MSKVVCGGDGGWLWTVVVKILHIKISLNNIKTIKYLTYSDQISA